MSSSSGIRIGSILQALCPACHDGKVLRGLFTIRNKCPTCGYNFHPEPGFYLGAMAIGFILTAVLTVPPVIILKVTGAELPVLIAFPFVEFLFVGTFLIFYCRILWLHLEYQMTQRLDGQKSGRTGQG